MQNRWLLACLWIVIFAMLPREAWSTKRTLILVGIEVHGRDPGQRIKGASGLSDMLGKRLATHLELMGERVLAMGSAGLSPREIPRSCPRECQLQLAQRKHADILRAEVVQEAEAYDLKISLWRFNPQTDQPLTDYPIEERASCDNCTEQRLSHTLTEHVTKLIERPEEGLARRGLSQPLLGALPSPIVPASQPRPPLSVARRATGIVFGTLSAALLGAGIGLVIMDSKVNGLPAPGNGRVYDLTKPYGTAFGLAGASLLVSILTLTIPQRGQREATPSLIVSRM